MKIKISSQTSVSCFSIYLPFQMRLSNSSIQVSTGPISRKIFQHQLKGTERNLKEDSEINGNFRTEIILSVILHLSRRDREFISILVIKLEKTIQSSLTQITVFMSPKIISPEITQQMPLPVSSLATKQVQDFCLRGQTF